LYGYFWLEKEGDCWNICIKTLIGVKIKLCTLWCLEMKMLFSSGYGKSFYERTMKALCLGGGFFTIKIPKGC